MPADTAIIQKASYKEGENIDKSGMGTPTYFNFVIMDILANALLQMSNLR